MMPITMPAISDWAKSSGVNMLCRGRLRRACLTSPLVGEVDPRRSLGVGEGGSANLSRSSQPPSLATSLREPATSPARGEVRPLLSLPALEGDFRLFPILVRLLVLQDQHGRREIVPEHALGLG